MRVLIVKTTSMGDVVHALPAASDLVQRFPGLELEWLVEAPFAAIPAMHRGVGRVLSLAWRKWRGKLLARETREAIAALRRDLRRKPYDLVIDLQGLFKSAIWARQARGPVGGYGRRTAREPLASLLYQRHVDVGWDLQAVERCRRLAAGLLGYPVPDTAPDFGLRAPEPGWMPPGPYAVLIPGASRVEKLWPERRWVAVGQRLRDSGLLPVVLWGSDAEQTLAERIAASCDGDVPPFLKVGQAAALLAGARQVVGLDTGFSHLAAAFGRPTLGIYCDHDPAECGITGSGPVASIGGRGQVPGQAEVMTLLEQQLARG
ncbi:MAG: lipopolysaccharide heptosyltransferase I [Burkholderiales bacterium]|nr:lipopolysaccharide heptosyltransferase I [Burkholderiales bacterium]MDE2455839.1 lipopolysaccharide heptosyltransferase I [Burkholderiales bacterium]